MEFKSPLGEEYILLNSLPLEKKLGHLQDLQQKFPFVWAETNPSHDQQPTPVIVELKTNTAPVKIKKYTMTLEDKQRIKVQIDRLLEVGILVPGHFIIAS